MSTKNRRNRKSLGRSVSDANLKDDEPITETPTVAQNRSSDVIDYDPDKSVGDVLEDLDEDDIPVENDEPAIYADSEPDEELVVDSAAPEDYETFDADSEYVDDPRVDFEESESYADSNDETLSEETSPESSASAGYFEDDEEWSASSDEILHSDEESVTAKQTDAVVTWDIDSLYTDEGKVRSKRSLKNSPPVLRISNSEGQSAEFVLTKDLSRVLANHLENTSRAYYGIRPKSEMSMKDKLSEAKTGLRENMGKAIVIGGLLAALVIFGIFF